MIYIMRGVSGGGKTRLSMSHFRTEQHLSSDNLRLEMFGTMNVEPSATSAIWSELNRRLEYRAQYRMLTVVDATNLTLKSINKLTRIIEKWGCAYQIVSLLPDREASRQTLQRRRAGAIPGAIMGDEVLDTMMERYHNNTQAIVSRYKDRFFEGNVRECSEFISHSIDTLYQEVVHDDVFVIGDIHGYIDELAELLKRIPQNAMIYSVGDVIDRGRDSLGSLFMLHSDPRFHGMTMGNHELAFLQELIDGKECRSKARRRTHTEFWRLVEREREQVIDMIKRAKPYIVLEYPDMRETAIISHAGSSTVDPMDLNMHMCVGNRINDVVDYRGDVIQVHGHSSWRYTGDFTGNVLNIDSCCYDTGILSAINPFTKEVISVQLD